MEQALHIENLSKIYRNVTEGPVGGLHDASFSLAPGQFFTLLGPSGCGKTTTLRCIAGLEQPDRGLISAGGQVFFDSANRRNVPMNRRNIGMVFQSYAIWPHMSVFENVAFPLRVAKDRKYVKDEIERLVDEALDAVSLGGFQSRSATRLSGGQQQRVALARAIVRKPKLLLLDEPLSNLDAGLREEMRNELKRLQRQIGVTTVYVTHDQAEALEMSDLVAVINAGEVVQIAAPRELYFQPRNTFVASFVGATNLLPGEVVRPPTNGVGQVKLWNGTVIQCAFSSHDQAPKSENVSVRPETIKLVKPNSPKADEHNRIGGRITFAGFTGSQSRYQIEVDGQVVRASSDPHEVFAVGDDVSLEFRYSDAVAVAA